MSKLANWFASHQLGLLNFFFHLNNLSSLKRPIRKEDNKVFNFFFNFRKAGYLYLIQAKT